LQGEGLYCAVEISGIRRMNKMTFIVFYCKDN
jgi:hypothetical protein